MKFPLSFVAVPLLAIAANCIAATTIQISAKFADVPAGTEVPEKPKGSEVLSSPTITTNPGKSATIEVTQSVAAPGGLEVPLGVSLSITPALTPKGNIAFSGKATDRFKHGQRDGESLSVLACVAREIYFKGTTTSGSTIVIKGSPSTVSAAKKDGANVVGNRELVIYLTFKKVTSEPEKKKPGKPAPKKKS